MLGLGSRRVRSVEPSRGLNAWVAALVLASGSVVTVPAAADIYQWTDASGTVHFTNRPSGNPAAKVVIKGNVTPNGGGASGAGQTVRAGVTPFAPQDRDPGRYTRFDEPIRQAAALYQIPESLVRAVIKVESDYDPRAVSYAGARGLMQLMPETADRMQVKDINDPRENIFGGVRYLRVLANMFNGDLDLTVAGYNAGEGAVVQYGGIPPYAQTKDYVVKVTQFYRRYRTIPDVVDASLMPWTPPAFVAPAVTAPPQVVAPAPVAPAPVAPAPVAPAAPPTAP